MTTNQISILAQGARPLVLLKYLGQLAVIQAVLTSVPLFVSIVAAEYHYSLHYAVLLAGLLLFAMLTTKLPTPAQLQTNEAFCLVALAFCLSALLMALPFWLHGLPFIDALFETVSGVTTTGLSTFATVADKPLTFLFARAWLQWYGGLGIVVFGIALIADHHLARRQFMEGADREHVASETRRYARSMLLVYVWLTLLGTVSLWLVTGKGFDALLLTMSAISTGGFAPYDDSLLSLSPMARLLVSLICAVGAIALPIYLLLWRRHWRQVLGDTEVQVFLGMAVGVTCALATLRVLQLAEPWWVTLQEAIILGFSAQTTTGFSSQPLTTLDDTSKIFVMIAMFTGGGLGSTAGGIKIMRLIMLWKAIQASVHRAVLPTHAVVPLQLGAHALANETLRQALLLILVFISVLVLSWWPFVLAGYDPLNSLFDVVSALATTGLSSGITQPSLEPWLKGILMFDMLAGRIEVIALIILLYPRTWLARRERP